MKKPFVTLEQLQEIVKQYPTPFHLYDEKGIRENARKVMKAFSIRWAFPALFAAWISRCSFAITATPVLKTV